MSTLITQAGRFKVEEKTRFIDVYVSKLLLFQDQVKMFHWNTRVYGQHKALDDLYAHLLRITDEFVEVYAGMYGEHPSVVKRSEISPNVKDLNTFLDSMRTQVASWQADAPVAGTTLEALLQELEGHIATARYLCLMS